MTLDKNALAAALEAFGRRAKDNGWESEPLQFAIEAYLAALPATSVSEPVAWQYRYWYSSGEAGVWLNERRADADDMLASGILIREDKRPLYTHPAPSEPVSDGLVRFDGVTMTPAAAANRIAELEHRSLAEGWRPIETAPKDGTVILVANEEGAIFTAWWVDDKDSIVGTDTGGPGWVDGTTNGYDDLQTYTPTHWRSLPQPPEAK